LADSLGRSSSAETDANQASSRETALTAFTRLYLHIPWCLSKCGYCAFFSAPGTAEQREETILLLLREMELATKHYAGGPLTSVYLGGGTPSLLTPHQVQRLLERSKQLWSHQPTCEVTLEANPGTATAESLAGFHQAGINRLSLGIQSLNDRTLQLLERPHNAAQSRTAYAEARGTGFRNISLDLICGLPHQSAEDWQHQLQQAIELAPEHLSIYSLSIEEGTPFSRRYSDDSPELPDDDQAAAMLELADQLLVTAGYEHYEIANFARPGHRSDHNSGYWLRDGYLGLGPSAHSLLLQGWGLRCSNPSDYQQWADRITAGQLAHHDPEQLSRQQALTEQLFLGLRMADGISPQACCELYGAQAWQPHEKTIVELLKTGLLEERGGRIALTQRGMLLSNQVFVRFI
jgi:oxygen-independent coproporphyrinogen III oxidase